MKEDTPAPMWTSGSSWSGSLVVKDGCWRAVPTPFPLELAFREIEKALEVGLFYLAIVVTLSIPDICARLELPPDRRVRDKHYTVWMNKYFLALHGGVNTAYAGLDGLDFYRLRCGIVHESTFGRGHTKFSHIFFYARKANDTDGKHLRFSLGYDRESEALVFQLDTATFCKDMMETARFWYRLNRQDANVRLNLPNLVRLRPNGFPPFCDVPVIG
jgi:hypothetical protein